MTRISLTIVAGVALAFALLGVLIWRNEIQIGLTYGWDTFPTHAPQKTCSWTKETFDKSGISFFLQSCPGPNTPWLYSEDSQGEILRTDEESQLLTFKVLKKPDSETPLAVVDEWFAKLSPEQKALCSVQSVDEPVEYLKDGSQSTIERPHPTAHKTRYRIAITPKIVQDVGNKFGGLPTGTKYDFLCGPDVGSKFTSYPPYFEFDDRSPSKYLFVGSLGNDDSILIDLNSIRF
jgi:hypothetical protein